MSRYQAMTCALVILLLASPARAAWDEYRANADGLAHSQVFAITEDREGRLWFGTADGASRFDGATWLTLRDSLRSRAVRAIAEDDSGAVWFGTESGGVARFDGQAWSYFDSTDGHLPSSQVRALLVDHRGDVWVGSVQGLARYRPVSGAWTTFTPVNSPLVHQNAWQLLEDDEHALWVGTPAGLSRLDSTRAGWTTYHRDPVALASDSVLSLGRGSDGSVWVGTDAGAFRFADGHWSRVRRADGLASDSVLAIAGDARGGIWFGTAGHGLSHQLTGATWWNVPESATGIALGKVFRLYVDRAGNLWIATEGAGLLRFDGTEWNVFDAADRPPPLGGCPALGAPSSRIHLDLADRHVTSLSEDRRGTVWATTSEGGVARFESTGTVTVWRRDIATPSSRPMSDSLRAFHEDRAGQLWFGASEGGLTMYAPATGDWRLFARADGLASDSVTYITGDAAGDLWVGGGDGVSRWNGSAWTTYLGGQSPPVEVGRIVEDASHEIWVETLGGLFRIGTDRTTVTRVTSLPAAARRSVCIATSGRIWIGSSSQGLVTWEAGALAPADPPLPAPGVGSVLGIHEDGTGAIWVVGASAVARLASGGWTRWGIGSGGVSGTPNGLLLEDGAGMVWVPTAFSVDRFNGTTWRRFTAADGLASSTASSLLRGRDGRLWFGGSCGLAIHDPDRTAPRVILLSRQLDALTNDRDFEFLAGTAYGEGGEIEFQYTVDGLTDPTWTATGRRTITGLADGAHEVSVEARDGSGNLGALVRDFEIDATAPSVTLASPTFGATVRDTMTVLASVTDAHPREWVLTLKSSEVPWSSTAVRELARGRGGLSMERIASLRTIELPDGGYELRLAASDSLGLSGTAEVSMVVDNVAPFREGTFPARVDPLTGSDVFTTRREVHVYFPPHAFDREVLAEIDSVDAGALAAPLPSRTARLTAPYTLRWSGGALVKPGVLDLAFAEPTHPARGTRSIYRWTGDTGWSRLGGTPADGAQRLSTTLDAIGTFAVMAESTTTASEGGQAVELTVVPRVLSLRSGGSVDPFGLASTGVAIMFALPQSTSADVRVYNRAGRLVRRVSAGTVFPAGSNVVRWDGRDEDGIRVVDGLYVVTLRAFGRVEQRTLSVIR